MTRLLLLRHAESEWNAEGRWQGLADPELSERGRNDARAAAARLEGSVARIVSSDLQRAAQTADIISDALRLGPVERMPDLREIDVGRWSGLTRAEIDERWPGAVERWRRGENVENDGEDRDAFRERIIAALGAVVGAGGGPILAVTHAGAISAVEIHLGVHPGVALPKMGGRWFDYDGSLRAAGDRIVLIDED